MPHSKAVPAPKPKRTIRQLVPQYQTTWEIVCTECEQTFYAKRRDARTCSGRCRARRFRRHRHELAELRRMVAEEPLFDRPLYPGRGIDLDLRTAFPWSRSG